MNTPHRVPQQTLIKELRHPIRRWAYIFLLPGLVWLCFLHFYPIGRAIYLSMHQWTGNLMHDPVPVGLSNFANIVREEEHRSSIAHTLYYLVLTVPFNTVLSLVVATLLNSLVRMRGTLRALYFLPSVVGLVVASTIWRWCYDPMFGLFNYLLSGIGIGPQTWLTDRKLAMPSIALMTIWQNMGYYVVIYLAGLTAIPKSLYEVSWMDGASTLRQFVSITFPLLAPTTFFVMMYSTIKNLKVFGEIFVMTAGGPAGATETIGFKVYEEAFVFRRFGLANALSITMFILILTVTLTQYLVLERRAEHDF